MRSEAPLGLEPAHPPIRDCLRVVGFIGLFDLVRPTRAPQKVTEHATRIPRRTGMAETATRG
jgi:hypothetical protein